jgi:hypothetical protein
MITIVIKLSVIFLAPTVFGTFTYRVLYIGSLIEVQAAMYVLAIYLELSIIFHFKLSG